MTRTGFKYKISAAALERKNPQEATSTLGTSLVHRLAQLEVSNYVADDIPNCEVELK
jgi:hypothetical protein